MDKEPSVICQLVPKYQPQPECSGHSSSWLSTCLGGLPLPRVLYGTSPHWCPCHSSWVNSCFLCWSDSPHLSLCPAHLWQPGAPQPGQHFLAIQIKLKCHISVQCCLTSSHVFLDSHPISCSSSHYRFGILLFGSLFLICFLIRMKAPGRRGPPLLSSLFYWKAWNRSFNTAGAHWATYEWFLIAEPPLCLVYARGRRCNGFLCRLNWKLSTWSHATPFAGTVHLICQVNS